ncbi:hypothetical protein DEI96_013495 [Curtobacterium sp. MCLR17_031]|uniref:hypothetical protein n=1 Tax=Curtobacterium sp. MCLR17_031 TaxID=2175622 RepID=UPI000DA900B8|nr:hypothetical protein [Curtobacterium sp. MCLR17_031]WIE57157.1 hypothetical protein DEI96_013495 [Curtobacterium sp. MCLR17_031]
MVAENDVRAMAARAQLVLSDDEFAGIVRLVNETGDLAPEPAVVERFNSGSLTPGMLTFFLPRMWRYRLGDAPVPIEVWRAMFEFAEYTEDMVVQRRRRGTRVAFRGATDANREGLSWSLDVEQARYFARDRQAPRDRSATVWVARIPSDRVYARYMDGFEKEIVADVRGLDVRSLEEWRSDGVPRWRRLSALARV